MKVGTMRRTEYRAYDEIVAGDVVDLGGTPREVLCVSRDALDRVRFIGVNRLACGHAKGLRGETKHYCTGPVLLYHTELFSGTRYRFRGWVKRAPSQGENHED